MRTIRLGDMVGCVQRTDFLVAKTGTRDGALHAPYTYIYLGRQESPGRCRIPMWSSAACCRFPSRDSLQALGDLVQQCVAGVGAGGQAPPIQSGSKLPNSTQDNPARFRRSQPPRHSRLFRIPALVLVLALAQCSQNAPQATTVQVTREVLLENPLRLGVNLGESTYYGDQQLVANPFAHGGFAKGQQTLLIRVKHATANTVTDAYADPSEPDRSYMVSFEDGAYYVATGERAGETGAIKKHPAGSGTFTLEHSGTPLAEGDVVWLKGPTASRALPDPERGETPLGIGDFRWFADEGVTAAFQDGENASGQVLCMRFLGGATPLRAGVKHYIKATPNTTYKVRVRARSTLAGAKLGIAMKNHGIPHGSPGNAVPFFRVPNTPLTAEWEDYVFEGSTYSSPKITDNFSAFSIVVSAAGTGGVYIDSIALEDERLDSPSGFARPVVEALKEARCGVLRFYGIANLSTLVDGITAANTTESSWTFLSLGSGFRFGTTCATVDPWMKLCQEVEAQPWITVGGPNTPDDWYDLISYLAAPANFDSYAGRRASHGFEEPWTRSFDTIYLEIGNEWWNGIFRPFYIWSPETYGELCAAIIERVREHPHFDDAKIEIIAGGWAVNAHHWNGLVDATCEGHDYISIAPYLLHELNDYAGMEDKYAPLFADVEAYFQAGGTSTLKDLAKNGKDTRLAVYELNTHITGGRAPASVASEVCPSVGAGVAVLDQAMSLMSRMGANPINYFTLLKRGYGHGEKQRLGLWGTLIREPNGALRPRPVWHGLRLANQYLIDGPMVSAKVDGSPTWNQKQNGSVPDTRGIPCVSAYAFLPSENAANVLLVNRSRAEELAVHIRLPFTPAPMVTRATLTSPVISNNNEELELVTLEEEEMQGFTQDKPVKLPPFSATVFQFTAQ